MPDGRTPLVAAAYEGHAEVCKELIAAGADVHHSDSTATKSDALGCAASQHHREVISLLIDHGASPSSEGAQKLCVIGDAINSSYRDATETVDQLLKWGASAKHASGNHEMSPMHIAAGYSQVGSIRVLLKYGADITQRDKEGWTALHHAAMYSSPSTAAALIENGADVNATDEAGRTSLHFAAHTMSVQTVRCLRRYGADINARDNANVSPLMLACCWDEATVQHLADPGGDDTLSVVDELLASGARVNARTVRGLTALHFAALCGRRDIACALIHAGARVDTRTRDDRTPLHHAAMTGRLDVVKMLASNGAGVNTTDVQGRTALHAAAARGHARTVRTLLELGATDLGRDRLGRSTLDAAARGGHLRTVTELLAHQAENAGTEVALRAQLLRSALAAARRHKREDVAKILLLHGAVASPQRRPCKVASIACVPGSCTESVANEDILYASNYVDDLVGGRREWISHLSASRSTSVIRS
jgi:ankyrin repeat protein